MLATASAVSTRPLSSPAIVATPARGCSYCCAALPTEAKKCGACGEWVVGTSGGVAAALLRLLAWGWGGASLLAAAGLWYGGSLVRAWLVARAVDPVVAPIVLTLVLYGLVAIVLLQGLTVAVGLTVVAGLAPRRPRWWTSRRF